MCPVLLHLRRCSIRNAVIAFFKRLSGNKGLAIRQMSPLNCSGSTTFCFSLVWFCWISASHAFNLKYQRKKCLFLHNYPSTAKLNNFYIFPFKIKSSRVDKSSKLLLTNQFVFEDGQLLARVHKSSKLLLVNWFVFRDKQLCQNDIMNSTCLCNIAENCVPWKQSSARGERKQQGRCSWARSSPTTASVHPGTSLHPGTSA